MSPKRIYLASPLGFAESTLAYMESLVQALEVHINVENPWDDLRFVDEFVEINRVDSVAERMERLGKVNREIGLSNTRRIDKADAVFAILDGVDVDSGTAAEIGYAFAKGKRVYGLRTDFRLAGDNEGAVVNLQVEYFINASGGSIVSTAGAFVTLAREFTSDDWRPSP